MLTLYWNSRVLEALALDELAIGYRWLLPDGSPSDGLGERYAFIITGPGIGAKLGLPGDFAIALSEREEDEDGVYFAMRMPAATAPHLAGMIGLRWQIAEVLANGAYKPRLDGQLKIGTTTGYNPPAETPVFSDGGILIIEDDESDGATATRKIRAIGTGRRGIASYVARFLAGRITAPTEEKEFELLRAPAVDAAVDAGAATEAALIATQGAIAETELTEAAREQLQSDAATLLAAGPQVAADRLATATARDIAVAAGGGLSGRQLLTPAALATGFYVGANGAQIASATYNNALFTFTGGEQEVRVTYELPASASAGVVAGVAFFSNADGTGFISAAELSTGAKVSKADQLVTRPANALSMRVTGSATTWTIGAVARYVSAPPAGLASTTDALGETKAVAATVISGKYYTSPGQASSGSYSTILVALDGSEIEFFATGVTNQGGAALLAFYAGNPDSGGRFIGTMFTGTGSSVTFTAQRFTPPSAATHIAVNSYTPANTVVPALAVRKLIDAKTRVPAVEASAASSAARVGAVEDTLVEWSDGGGVLTVGSYVFINGGIGNAAGRQYRKFAVSPGERGYRVTSTVQDPQALVVYKAANDTTVLGTEQYSSTDNTRRDFDRYVLTPPAGTAFIYINGRANVGAGVTRIERLAAAANVAQRLASVEGRSTGLGSSDLCIWGDSTSTAASGFADELAALYPGRVTYQQGIGGQRAEHIAARMGALPVTLVAGITIPTAGPVTIAFANLSTDLLRLASGTAVIKVLVAGVTCALSFDAAGAGGAGAYTLTPLDYPPAPVAAAAGTRVEVLTGFVAGTDSTACVSLAKLLGGVVIIRACRNNINGIVDLAPLYRLIDAMVAQTRRYTDKIILIGQMLGYVDLPTSQGGNRTSDEISFAIFNNGVQINEYLRRTYADWFVDAQANHVANDGGTARTINPNGVAKTFTVLTASATSPKLIDGLHENALGQQQTAALLQTAIDLRKL